MRIQPTSVKIEVCESIYWYGKVLTQPIDDPSSPISQIPFEIKLAMPKPDRGGRGYSNILVIQLHNELRH